MRKTKKIIVVKTLREWLSKGEKLEPDQIVVVDYETKDPIASGMLMAQDSGATSRGLDIPRITSPRVVCSSIITDPSKSSSSAV